MAMRPAYREAIFFRANQLTARHRRGDPGAVLAFLALLLVLVPLAGRPAAAEPARLVGTVGPGFTIDLADANGNHVDAVVAGRYELLVHDLSDMHNFVLGNKATGARPAQTTVEFVGDQTFTVDLVPGLYVYACSPHFDVMNGRLTVMAPPTPTVPILRAKVDARSVSLSATTAEPGRYRITVTDRSHSRNFHLRGAGVDRRTGKSFTGTVTWKLKLDSGTYRFGSDPKLSRRLVVG
jgi:plastocyanin